MQKAAILATDGTIRTGVYHKELEAVGITPWTPAEDVQKVVMDLIYEEIKQGGHGKVETFDVIDRAVKAAGCDGAILGCTELSVYSRYHELSGFYIDAMLLLCRDSILAMGRNVRKD